MSLQIHVPSLALLPGYIEALEKGFSTSTIVDTARRDLEAIRQDAEKFLKKFDVDCDEPVELPDGTKVARLPCHTRWLFDEEGFCGQVSFRWQRGTDELPAHVLGHIGYAIVPWKRGRGYGTQALAMMLPIARMEGLGRLHITCNHDNKWSQRIIERNGGRLVRAFVHPMYGDVTRLLFVLDL